VSEAWTSFTIGLLATTSPCILPLYPGFLAFLGLQTDHGKGPPRWVLGLAVLAGVMIMMIVLGGAIALLSLPVGSVLAYIIPLSNLILFTLGVLLLLDKNPFKQMLQLRSPVFKNPVISAFIYGLMYGPISLPCSGPLLVSIFAISLSAGETLQRLSTFLWFGLGFGLPLFILAFIAQATQKKFTRWVATHNRLINIIGGIFLIGLSVFDMIQNWENIALILFSN
jgi:cytochrome c-type biogenesis protein